MIQRIQTIYLFLATALTVLLLFFPLVYFSTETNGKFMLDAFKISGSSEKGITISENTIAICLMIIAVSLTQFVSIFLYSKRKLQKVLVWLSLFFQAILIIIIYTYTTRFASTFSATIDYNYILVIPFISFTFCFLAQKRIKADDDLVKSYDRIR